LILSRSFGSRLEDPRQASLIGADPTRIAVGVPPILIDAGGVLEGREGIVALPRAGTLLGQLYESLVTQRQAGRRSTSSSNVGTDVSSLWR